MVITLIITAGVVLTFSRGAAVGFLLMVVVMTFMRLIKPHHLVIVIVAGILMLALLPQYGTRFASLQSLSNFFSEDQNVDDGILESRSTEMLAALQVFADHPLIGVGPGMFKYYSAEYGEQINPGVLEGTREAHSLYLGIAADHGLLGLVSFLGIIIITLYTLLRSRERLAKTRPDLLNLINAFILAVVTYLATGLFLHLSYARYLWLILALAGAAGVIAKEAKKLTIVEAPAPIESYVVWPAFSEVRPFPSPIKEKT
jgi:O-antigen ligase